MTLKEYLNGKNIVFYGDSITHNWDKYTHDMELLHPEDPNYQYGLGQGYVRWIGDQVNYKSINNFSVSGGCYANCEDIHPGRKTWRHFPHQVANSLETLKNADVVFVFFGTNDYATQVKFGDFTDMPINELDKEMTFYGGMNYGFNLIKKTNPNVKIFVINCLTRVLDIDPGFTFNYSINEYNLAISHKCRIDNLHLVDVTNLFSINPNNGNPILVNDSNEKVSDDGLHPNTFGHKELANRILEENI